LFFHFFDLTGEFLEFQIGEVAHFLVIGSGEFFCLVILAEEGSVLCADPHDIFQLRAFLGEFDHFLVILHVLIH